MPVRHATVLEATSALGVGPSGIGGLLIAARAALPGLVERYVNRELGALEGYSGRVVDIDLSSWRGAYVIEGLRIVKTGGNVPVSFFSARAVDISIEWKALLDGDMRGRSR